MIQSLSVHFLLPLLAAPFVGSFLGVLVERLPEGRPVVLGRSACRHCGHRLGAFDLVPVLSWLASGGRCRYCGGGIGAFHPAIETAALVVAVWSVLVLPGWLVWAGCGLGWTMLALAAIDIRHLLLPDRLTLPLLGAGLLLALAIAAERWTDHALGALAGFLVLLGVAWLYRRLRGRDGLGGGDAKLLGAIGAWTGWEGLPSVILYGAAAGLLWSLVSARLGRRLDWDTRVPFGPFLCLGGWLVWLYGPLQ